MGVSSAKALAAARAPAARPGGPPPRPRGGEHARPDPVEPPYLCLVASGGHTFLARVDDPRALQGARPDARRRRRRGVRQGRPPARPRLPRRPGDRPARARGRPTAFDFPRSTPGELDFSFWGLKTALLYTVRDLGEEETAAPAGGPGGLLPARDRGEPVARTRAALEREGLRRLALGGGVAANSELRARRRASSDAGVWVPAAELCTDNAAMIAGAARFVEPLPYPEYLALDARRGPHERRGPLRQAGLPPLRGGARGGRARAPSGFELEEVDISHRPRASRASTASESRWSTVDGEEVARLLRGRRSVASGWVEWPRELQRPMTGGGVGVADRGSERSRSASRPGSPAISRS